MSPPTRFSKQDVSVMVNMRLDGASYRQIASEFDISHAHAHYILTGQSKFADIDGDMLERLKQVSRPNNRALDREQVLKAVKLWYADHTHREIAEKLGVSRSCITYLVSGYTYREIK